MLKELGNEISQWLGGEKIHCYYPKTLNSTKQLEIDIPIIEGSVGAVRENITLAGNELKMALNANGVYVNGTKVDNVSESQHFHNLVTHKTAQIGSTQGNTRSKATYNRVGIHNRLLSSEELITLTSTGALAEEI